MPTSNCAKVGIRILVIDFQGNILMSWNRFQNLLRPSISDFGSKQNEKKCNGVTELREQAEEFPSPHFGICDTTQFSNKFTGKVSIVRLDCIT